MRFLLLALWCCLAFLLVCVNSGVRGQVQVPAKSQAKSATDPELERKLSKLIKPFEGTVGIWVKHVPTGKVVAIRADETFPTASMIKLPILVALMTKIEAGELGWNDKLKYTKDRLYSGADVLGSFKDGEFIRLRKLAHLMCALSDNTASLWLQELCGTGVKINEWLAQHGYAHTRMNSRTPGRKADWKKFGWGQTSPREMGELLESIVAGRCVSPAADYVMQRTLSKTWWDGEALSAFPPGVEVASKQGAVSQSRSEVAYVHAPHGAFVFCVITKGQKDASWRHDNAGYVLMRSVGATLWAHFEMKAFAPPKGIERYR